MHVEFGPIDSLNPELGYWIRITGDNGNKLYAASCNPVTGADLLSPEDCMIVAGYYLMVNVSKKTN